MSAGKPIFAQGFVDPQLMALSFAVHERGKGWRRLSMFFAGLIAGILAVRFLLRREDGFALLGYVLLCVALLLVSVPILTTKNMIRRRMLKVIEKQYAQMDKRREEILYEFHHDHCRITTKQIDTRMSWDVFCKWKAGDGLLLLYQNDQFFQVIPIAQFDAAAQEALMALVAARLPAAA